jgi:hypothetical protein
MSTNKEREKLNTSLQLSNEKVIQLYPTIPLTFCRSLWDVHEIA